MTIEEAHSKKTRVEELEATARADPASVLTTNHNNNNNNSNNANADETPDAEGTLARGSEEASAANARLSPVARFFDGNSVFITGASGFIGRVLLEKLLRCYPTIRRIYILLRPKKNLQPYERLHKHLLKVPIFDNIRSMKNGQELLDKIVVISGDIGEDDLGISLEDRKKLLNDASLSIVFHSAASVKFDEPLKQSIKFNLQATKLIVQLCKEMSNLKCLCHVSTAYVNSDLRDNQDIEERLYPMRENPEQVIRMAELMDEELMQSVKPHLVGRRPNTYTYTKALSEHLIALEASNLPVAIVRPSIVVASWKEPLRGWVDNLNGATGLVLAIGKGLLRTMRAVRSCKADVIPVDIVVNTMIAAAHFVALEADDKGSTSVARGQIANGNRRNSEGTDDKLDCDFASKATETTTNPTTTTAPTTSKQPPIFHCTSGDVNPITWGDMEDLFWPIILKYPSRQVLRYPYGTFKANKYHDLFMRLWVHLLPALIIDLLCWITGRKRQMLSIYNKLHRATEALENFCTTNYNFNSKNLRKLQQSLTHPLDRSQLYMDISRLDWISFWDDYILGARRFVLKEEDQTLGESLKSFQRAKYVEWALRAVLTLLTLACLYPLVGAPLTQVASISIERLMSAA